MHLGTRALPTQEPEISQARHTLARVRVVREHVWDVFLSRFTWGFIFELEHACNLFLQPQSCPLFSSLHITPSLRSIVPETRHVNCYDPRCLPRACPAAAQPLAGGTRSRPTGTPRQRNER